MLKENIVDSSHLLSFIQNIFATCTHKKKEEQKMKCDDEDEDGDCKGVG